ncbi:mediator of DNA damage checkpoint protein 1 [Bactrocera dorsalis]|uniref:Mediator of DNA damage checkpoint protein 1 n=1 Tax=Bactrocera dorsalis TaxID=27457 RepID=A0A6I9V0U9_BACDO|nr:mediator of DNA damage checkpoint protein 1 [Bactrocera dorsalis]
MTEKKWTLDVDSNQYDLVSGKLYLIGCRKDGENIKQCVDIALKSQSVDTKHCIVDVSSSKIYIIDLYSASGTFVNNKRLNPMIKESINVNSELRFGELSGSLKEIENLNFADPFLAPTQRAPRSSLSNTSTRLFSSPDVSLMNDTRNESFDIPETQNIKQRTSIENSSILSSSRNQSCDGKSFCDESFIPETQMPSKPEQSYEASELDSNLHKSGDFIRICTQDFNENLFEDGDDDEAMFSSLVIPNIQHKPVILTDVTLNMDIDEDVSQIDKCDVEVEALNTQAPKNETSNDPDQNTICTERDDACTPDLFDLPEMAHVNVQANTNGSAEENLEKDILKEGQVNEVIAGDGYAEEVDMMATQVFVPISKQPDDKVTGLTHTGEELSLSGKENIANTDFSLEQTQVFAPIKEGYLVASRSIEKSATTTIENIQENTSLLAPTQIFTSNLNDSASQSKIWNKTEPNDKTIKPAVRPKLNLTITPNEIKAKEKSDGSFSNETDNGSARKEVEQALFKKPKLNKINKGAKGSTSSINSSQSEAEGSLLCTPKWICEKFDLLSEEHVKMPLHKRNLFGSDSEEESLELNKLDKRKDSTDFDKLLCNVKEKQPLTKYVPAKSPMIKQEDRADVKKVSSNKKDQSANEEVILEKPDKKLEEKSYVKKPKISPPSIKNSTKEKSKTDGKVEPSSGNRRSSGRNNKPVEEDEKREERKKSTKTISKKDEIEAGSRKVDPKKEVEKNEKHKKPTKNVSSKGENTDEMEEVPTRRVTRLRSRTSDKDNDTATCSTAGPTQAKLRKLEHTDEPEISKKRVTRSRSKTDSQESITSTKSTSSSRSASKKNAREVEKRGKNNSDSKDDKTSANVSNTSKDNEPEFKTSAKDHNRKRSAGEPSVEESKKLKNNVRILQIAMTMVEPKLFQSLVENSPGNWCVANDPTDADVLVMDKGNRTLKFLIAMAKGIPIVTSKWLQSFNSTKTVPRGITHFFRDHDFEKRHKFSLFKSLELARTQKLFEGYDFVTTPSILPRPSEIKQIIECAGGKVYDEPPPPKSDQKIYVISTMNDKKYWHKYRRSNTNIRITDSEGVMASVMRQSTHPLDLNVFA